jgi:hypothetical protein
MVFPIVGGVIQGEGYSGQPSGYPDIILDHPRYHGYIEFKGEKTKLRADQKLVIQKLKETGANVYIVRSPNIIEDEEGRQLLTFVQTGIALLHSLEGLVNGQT